MLERTHRSRLIKNYDHDYSQSDPYSEANQTRHRHTGAKKGIKTVPFRDYFESLGVHRKFRLNFRFI